MVIFLCVTLVVLAFIYRIYVSLIQKKNTLKEASSGVDVQLKKRYDLIPNVLSMTASYMTHEKQLFEQIVMLRNDALKQNFATDTKKAIEIDNNLNDMMKALFVNVENYPELKSNQTMVQATQSFQDAEENIAAARRFYNSALTELKNAVEIFPSSVIASLLSIKADKPYFETSEEQKRPVNAKEYFK